MRAISANLETAQERNTRHPISRAVIYDTMLRWTELTDSFYDTGYPDLTSGGIPQAMVDASITGGIAYVAWASGVLARLLTITNLTTWAEAVTTRTITAPHRVSVFGDDLYRYYDGDIYNNAVSIATVGVGDYALAATASDEVYVAELDTECVYLSFYASGVSDHMDYGIPVPDDYTIASLSWFDAVRTSDGDYIFYNSETYGKPMIIKRADGIWGTPRPMIPVDIVDNYSYLRIGWVTYEDGVFYATGELAGGDPPGRTLKKWP